MKEKEADTEEACTSKICKWNVPRKRKVDIVPIAHMKFSKHEHGKVKKQKHSVISPEHDARPAIRNDSHAHNTRMYSIYSKVMDFQSKTNKILD